MDSRLPRANCGLVRLLVSQTRCALVMAALALAAWTFLVWLMVNMSHPLAQLTMPASAQWRGPEVLAIWLMWAVMMAAMMLPSAVPIVLLFARMGTDQASPQANGRPSLRLAFFLLGYIGVWTVFSVGATAAQWLFQAQGWISPMLASTSAGLSAGLLLMAGVYQFSPLKRVCLTSCQTPMGFLLSQWHAGTSGAFLMGLRHGLICMGCCWALMALLFVGGVMNLPWIAALTVGVALEKIAPFGQKLSYVLGLALLGIGLFKLWPLLF